MEAPWQYQVHQNSARHDEADLDSRSEFVRNVSFMTSIQIIRHQRLASDVHHDD